LRKYSVGLPAVPAFHDGLADPDCGAQAEKPVPNNVGATILVRFGRCAYRIQMMLPDQPPSGPESPPAAMLRFAAIAWREKGLSLLAFMLILTSAVVLKLVHFRWIAPLLGRSMDAVAYVPLASARQLSDARMVRRTVLRAARLSPLRSDCLPQAMVAAILCRLLQVPAAVHLGVKLDKGPGKIDAHAWVCSGRETICGGRSFGRYTPVSCFVSEKRR
jgi:hypothetical protein